MAAATLRSDRWLWAAAVVLVPCALLGIRRAITDILQLTEVELLPDAHGKFSSHDSERQSVAEPDASTIRLFTLQSLLKSPHDTIRSSAQWIVIQRCCTDPAQLRLLVADNFSHDPVTSRAAQRTVEYLLDATRDASGAKFALSRPAFSILFQLHELNRARRKDVTTPAEFWAMCRRSVRAWAGVPKASGEGRWPSASELQSSPLSRLANAADRRRRHREAMVLHEGDGRLEEGDIIRPQR